MTEPLNPATSPGTPSEPASSPEPPMPDYEVVELGTSAQAVARETGASGTQSAGPRSSRVRWGIALVGVALVGLLTAAIIALAAGRPNPSIAVGYMPTSITQYMEVRLDLPGDQRQKLAGFLSVFPGFDDQAAIQTKLNETFDRIVAAASSNEQTYTADIEPWFGGQIALGTGSTMPVPDPSGPQVLGSPEALMVVSIKDRELAADWIDEIGNGELARGDYNGAILFTDTSELDLAFAIAVNDEAILAGPHDIVTAAVDSNGDGSLAEDPEFKAAFGVVSRDYVFFSFTDQQANLAASLEVLGEMEGLDAALVDELVALVPAWTGAYGRFESDAFVTDSAQPSADIGVNATNRKSTLLGYAPPGTVAYAEWHDAGATVTALYDKVAQVPKLEQGVSEVEEMIGIEAEEVFGWWGDVAFVVSEDGDGLLGGGVLIKPTDAAAAQRLADVVRGFAVLGGGSAGIEVRDVQHGDATITVIDFSEAAGTAADPLPSGYKAEIAYAVTDDVVIIGYGQAFVESALDAGPGPSLADDARVASLAKRVGEENLGFTFVDVRGLRELIEPIARNEMPADEWAHYETEIQPFLLPFDAFASAVREDGDLDRISAVVTVTQPAPPASAGR